MLADLKSKLLGVNPITVLMGVSINGVVMTAYLTGRASFKAARIIDAEERVREERRFFDEKARNPEGTYGSPPMTNKEKALLVWPHFIPPAALMVTTISAIILNNHEASKKVAAFAAASGVSERAFQEYKAKVVEKLGEKKDEAIRAEIAQDRVNSNPPPAKEIVVVGSGDSLFMDGQSGRYFMSTVEKVRQAQNTLNYDIMAHQYASLTAWYDLLGLRPNSYSDVVGWNSDKLVEVQLSTTMTEDGRACIVVDFEIPPFAEYNVLY